MDLLKIRLRYDAIRPRPYAASITGGMTRRMTFWGFQRPPTASQGRLRVRRGAEADVDAGPHPRETHGAEDPESITAALPAAFSHLPSLKAANRSGRVGRGNGG